MKVYIGGCSGIKKTVDVDGRPIKEGDVLTFSWWWEGSKNNPNEATREQMKPCLIVKKHHSGKGLYAEGINEKLYNHDFTFRYTKNLTAIKNGKGE